MKTKVPYYFKDFKCISSQCSDSCCIGWEIIIDDDTYEHYYSVPGTFGDKLRSKITLFEDDDPGFALVNGNCPFLNKDKLCDIYTNIGEDSLCYTCKTFPRFIEEYGDFTEIGISLSCPEAARLILKDDKKVTFEIADEDDVYNTYDEIYFEIYKEIMPVRLTAINILQDRTIKLNERIALYLSFSYDIQNKINLHELSKISNIISSYNNKENRMTKLDELKSYGNDLDTKFKSMPKYFAIYDNLEHLKSIWPLMLKESSELLYNNLETYQKQYRKFIDYYNDKQYEFEHLLVYFTYRYFMKSIFDDDLISKVKFAVVSYLMIMDLDIARFTRNNEFTFNDQIDIMHLYSKEIEHSEGNLEILFDKFDNDDLFNFKTLLSCILS